MKQLLLHNANCAVSRLELSRRDCIIEWYVAEGGWQCVVQMRELAARSLYPPAVLVSVSGDATTQVE